MSAKKVGWVTRLIRALVTVLLIVGLAPCIDAVGRAVRIGSAAQEVLADPVGDETFQLKRVLSGIPDAMDSVPASFERETFPFSSLRSVCCSKENGVIGFSLEGTAVSSFVCVREWLESSGWSCQESGRSNMASFSKGDGAYRWLFVSCEAIGGQSLVVMQCSGFQEE